MRITKFGHSCVRLEHAGQVLVVDPGGFSEREAVDGATAVLVTHEHPDHLDLDHLRACDAVVHTIESVRARIAEADAGLAERVRVVAPGESFDAGLAVTAVGELHAEIHRDLPRVGNSGFVVDVGGTRVYHPGDALTPPGGAVDMLLLPVHAPWSRFGEVLDFARRVAAPLSVAIHDGLLNADGLGVLERNFAMLLGDEQDYRRVEPGGDVAG